MTQTAKILSVNPALVQREQGQPVNHVSNARVSQFQWIPAKRKPDELNGTYQDLWVGGTPPDRLSIEITKQKNEPEQVKVFKTAIKTKEEETIGVWGRRAWGHMAPHVSAKLSIPHSFNSDRHAAALTSGDIRQLGGSEQVFDLFFDASDYDLSRPGTPVSPIGRAEVPQLIASLQKSRGFDINGSYVGISDQNQLEKVIQFRARRLAKVLKKVSKDFNSGRFDPGHRAHMLGTRSIFLDDYYNSHSFLLSEVRFNRYSPRYRRSEETFGGMLANAARLADSLRADFINIDRSSNVGGGSQVTPTDIFSNPTFQSLVGEMNQELVAPQLFVFQESVYDILDISMYKGLLPSRFGATHMLTALGSSEGVNGITEPPVGNVIYLTREGYQAFSKAIEPEVIKALKTRLRGVEYTPSALLAPAGPPLNVQP